ncbi:TIGR02391 family protein [Rathayibacter sp. VKM Ac-2928]|uniref:TIGR02391 family protein n=1 Tax=Rathayibacter sp. VKM Ac-2928 TaxID=2929479 RepID=UPI001FB2BE05|nr:TIGR02391 family protein [Rathayibacter sp. VKM Ac-2928]MCJ1682341.1 TIGR02391 family protein [Rathayibacter sp. VKM Ac-2928]
MPTTHAPFSAGVLEQTCRLLAELYTGTELTRIRAEVPLRQDPGEAVTKWRRLAHAVSANQVKTQTGNALLALIRASMEPDRTISRAEAARRTRDELNQVLSLAGFKVREDGQVARVVETRTVDDALDRTDRLQALLVRRGAHDKVLTYCRPELLRKDYYEAVFEAIKGLGSRIRQMTGVDADGYKLIDVTMSGPNPQLRINSLQTRTQRDEQTGVGNLAKGLFSAFRNPAAHEPRIEWVLTEHDALDVLGTLSLIHRRLDASEALRRSAL